jgi:hypothetical protein
MAVNLVQWVGLAILVAVGTVGLVDLTFWVRARMRTKAAPPSGETAANPFQRKAA